MKQNYIKILRKENKQLFEQLNNSIFNQIKCNLIGKGYPVSIQEYQIYYYSNLEYLIYPNKERICYSKKPKSVSYKQHSESIYFKHMIVDCKNIPLIEFPSVLEYSLISYKKVLVFVKDSEWVIYLDDTDNTITIIGENKNETKVIELLNEIIKV